MGIFDRTFHPDEANQAFTTGRLLETGIYRYDPHDHHGPTLYYAAAAIQKAAGHSGTATLDASLLRCTPLLFAILALLFGLLAFKKLTGRLWHGILFATLLATSPIFVFLATDFIQEMLLASFTLMMLWSAIGYCHSTNRQPETRNQKPETRNQKPSNSNSELQLTANRQPLTAKIKPGTWALLFGIAAGLAFATKETSILAFAAAAIAFPVSRLMFKASSNSPLQLSPPTPTLNSNSNFILAFAGFALTSILLYSSFASNWQGVYNAFVLAPLSYIHRAAGGAASQGAAAHVHPWWMYLKWLFAGNAIAPATALLGILSGGLAFMSKDFRENTPDRMRNFFAFMVLYTAILAVLYSAIPYKTPWCALQLHIPMLVSAVAGLSILAGAVCKAGLKRNKSLQPRLAAVMSYLVLLPGFCGLILAGNIASLARMWRNPDSREIPCNYASASPQVKDLASLISSSLAASNSPFAAVALPPEDTWPLPFYLRAVNGKVGYWTSFGELEALAGLGAKPDVVVVPAEEGHLVQPLFPHLTGTKRFEMRNRVRVRAFFRRQDLPSTSRIRP